MVLRLKLVLLLTEIFQYWYLTNVPPDGWVWQKAFFWWFLAQGHGPDMPCNFKNASGPFVIPLKRAPLAPSGKPNPPRRVKDCRDSPWGSRIWPSSKDARQSAEKLLHELKIFQYWIFSLSPTRQDLKQGQWLEGRL